MGISSMVSRVGAILTPVFLSLHDVISWLPSIIFAGTSIIGGIASLYLPETRGKQLLETFNDAKELYMRS